MTYLLTKSFKINTSKKRTLLAFAVIFCISAAVFCIDYYSGAFESFIERSAEECLSRLSYRFNPDFQWKNLDFNTPFTDNSFNSDGSMDKYNVPIYTERDFFDGFSDSEYLIDSALAYTLQSHNVFDIDLNRLDEDEIRQYEYNSEQYENNLIYGADFDDFVSLSCGRRQTGTGELKVKIVEGKAHGKGECIICKSTADKFGYGIGDVITVDGGFGRSAHLIISGLFTYYLDDTPEEALSDFESLRIQQTNPFFRIRYQAMRYMVITDFNTAYDLVPEGMHEINGYIYGCRLKDYRDLDSFTAVLNIPPEISSVMVFYPDSVRYDYLTEAVINGMSVMKKFAIALAAAGIIIAGAMLLFICRERTREAGILAAVGVKNNDIAAQRIFETAVYAIAASALAVIAGRIMTELSCSSNGYFNSLGLVFSSPTVIYHSLIAAAVITVFFAVIQYISLAASPSDMLRR